MRGRETLAVYIPALGWSGGCASQSSSEEEPFILFCAQKLNQSKGWTEIKIILKQEELLSGLSSAFTLCLAMKIPELQV